MDVARGGKFTSVPASYPASAWSQQNIILFRPNIRCLDFYDWYDCTYEGTPTMIEHVTTAAWQQNMCTGAYLPMWEGGDPAYIKSQHITLLQHC